LIKAVHSKSSASRPGKHLSKPSLQSLGGKWFIEARPIRQLHKVYTHARRARVSTLKAKKRCMTGLDGARQRGMLFAGKGTAALKSSNKSISIAPTPWVSKSKTVQADPRTVGKRNRSKLQN